MPGKIGLRRERLAVTEEILLGHTIGNQFELVQRLQERGFQVTQSSVSRDLRDMGAIRVEGRYLPASALSGPDPHSPELQRVANFILDMEPAGPNLLAIKTPPGLASCVALAIDRAGWAEVAGTVAGDDTFFLATPGHRQQKLVEAKLTVIMKEASGG